MKEGTMNNNSNKKAVTILSLAMVLALPITSNADGQETEENVHNTPNYTGVGTENKLEEEIRNILEEEPEVTLTVEKEEDKNLTLEENNDSINSSEKSEEATETTIKEEQTQDSQKAVVEEKEASTLTEEQKQDLKEAGFTDEQIAEIEEEIAGELKADPNFDIDSFLKEITAQKAVEAEMGEAKPEPVAADDAITNVKISIGGAKNGNNTTTVNPTASADRIDTTDTDLNLETKIDFDIPKGTKAGKYFDVEISDNVNFNGIVAEEDIKPIKYNGEVVATGEKLTDGRRGYRYTFNKNIDSLTDVRVSLLYPLFIDPKTVPTNSEKETVIVKVAGKEYSKDYKVQYENGVFDYEDGAPTLSGSANIVNVTDETYEHIIYVNPTADQEVKNPHILIKNQEGYSTATFDDEVKNSVKVYRIKNTDDFNLSYHLDYNNLEKVDANVEVVEDLFGSEDAPKELKVDITNNDFKKDVYVITYTGKREAGKATKTEVDFTAQRRRYYDNNGNPHETGATAADFGWNWKNEILFDDPEANATGDKAYNLGDRVWIDDNKDGLQTEGEKGLAGVTVKLTGEGIEEQTTTTDENGNYKFEGLKNGDYKVTFELPKGYKVTDTNIGDDDEKDSDGLEVTATIKDADNMSVDLGLVVEEKTYTLGDRVWIDENKDGIQTEGEKGLAGVTVKLTGERIEEQTTTTDENGNYKFEGLKNGDYKVTFETPEGYNITKTNIGDDDEKDSDGLEVTATIKDADNMSVDLGLIKKEAPVEETYSLGDRVWLDNNKDGLQTEGEKGVEGVTVKLTGEGIEEKTTTTDANGNYKFEGLKNGDYTVTFETPEGYDITKTNIGKDDEKDSDGTEVKATIKDADNMSVDLGLVKKEKPLEPSEPVEPDTPWTPLEPSEPVEPDTPWTPLEPSEPVEPDTPWTPLEPSEPVEPGTPEDPEKPVTPEKPGKPSEPEKPTNPDKPVTPVKPQDPQSPVTDNKPTKDEKVENPKTPTKTMETIKTHGSTKQASKNPKTGLGSSVGIAGIAISSILASIGVEKKKKEDK